MRSGPCHFFGKEESGVFFSLVWLIMKDFICQTFDLDKTYLTEDMFDHRSNTVNLSSREIKVDPYPEG